MKLTSKRNNNQKSYADELEFAQKLAREAGKIMRQYYEANQHKQLKSDGTFVTIADTKINSMVIKAISQRFPDDGIIGEEESSADYSLGRRWICDPIDGTFAFIIGLPTFTFSLCLVIDSQPSVAVVYVPQSDKIYTAIRGNGAFCGNQKLKVSRDNVETGIIGLAPDYIRPNFIEETFMKRLLAYDKRLAICDGAVFRGCMVARGKIAGFPHPRTKPWDVAAVHLLVEEAGGKVTDIHGHPLDYSKYFEGAVVSNGVIHDDLLALFSKNESA